MPRGCWYIISRKTAYAVLNVDRVYVNLPSIHTVMTKIERDESRQRGVIFDFFLLHALSGFYEIWWARKQRTYPGSTLCHINTIHHLINISNRASRRRRSSISLQKWMTIQTAAWMVSNIRNPIVREIAIIELKKKHIKWLIDGCGAGGYVPGFFFVLCLPSSTAMRSFEWLCISNLW